MRNLVLLAPMVLIVQMVKMYMTVLKEHTNIIMMYILENPAKLVDKEHTHWYLDKLNVTDVQLDILVKILVKLLFPAHLDITNMKQILKEDINAINVVLDIIKISLDNQNVKYVPKDTLVVILLNYLLCVNLVLINLIIKT